MAENIHVVKEKYFLLLTGVFIVLLILFANYFEIVLPIGITILTIYYFISFNSTCPKCDKPFSKKLLYKKVVDHLSTFSEADMDTVDASFEMVQSNYECKHCKHAWNEVKKSRSK